MGLREIPGVGPSIEKDLFGLGVTSVEQLRGHDPEALYEQLQARAGGHVDRCMLYVFRCAVYYAEGGCDPAKLQWWYWKDERPARRPADRRTAPRGRDER